MKAGYYQFAPEFGNVERNIGSVLNILHNEEFDLVVLPELFNTGYQFTSRKEALSLSETIPDGPTTRALASLSSEKGCYVVFGIAEKLNGKSFNSAVITGPNGYIGTYRKTHLFDDEKLWFSPGDTGFKVWTTPLGNIGIMICFDWFFPESMRSLSLLGADIIAHPSNLVLPYCPDSMPVRCRENAVFSITANRTGREERLHNKALSFIGMSQITSLRGEILKRAPVEDDELFFTTLDALSSRNKRLTLNNDLFGDRRPEMYTIITQPGL